MKILRNYILKDFLTAFTFSLLLFTVVMLMGNLMKLSDMIRKGVSLFDAIKIISFCLPVLLKYTLPLSFLLGVLLAMGRLIADNEIVAIHVAGISFYKILKVFLLVGIIFSLFLFILNDRIIPGFHYRYRDQMKNIYSKNINALIEPGVSLENFPNHILYVSDRKENKLKNIYIYEVSKQEGLSKVIYAKGGEFVVENNVLKMKLEDGFRDETNPKNHKELYRLNFKIFFMDMPFEQKERVQIEKKPKDMKLTELRSKIRYFAELGVTPPVEYLGEFHSRISFSLSIIIFIILGMGVSLIVKHREKTINFGIAMLIAGSYYLLFILGETLLEYRILIPSIGMWLPNIITASIGGFLLYKHASCR